MYNQQEIHIIEERNNLFWALIILVCTSAGTYLLTGAFITMDWHFFTLNQIIACFFFVISFIGIFKISEPLYHFIFYFRDGLLMIETEKGSLPVDTQKIPLSDITELKFEPHYQRSKGEALFDFSSTYHLMWRKKTESEFKRMLLPPSDSITLKVDDIAQIMRFITEKNTDISIPPEQAHYFNL